MVFPTGVRYCHRVTDILPSNRAPQIPAINVLRIRIRIEIDRGSESLSAYLLRDSGRAPNASCILQPEDISASIMPASIGNPPCLGAIYLCLDRFLLLSKKVFLDLKPRKSARLCQIRIMILFTP